jgi:serine/threonine protein phosphatase PrpC
MEPAASYAAPETRVSVFARTHRGPRPTNQDAFLVADLTAERVGLGADVTSHAIGERGTLLAVSDGAGDAGETASELALIAFHRLLSVLPADSPAEVRMARAAHHTAKYLYGHYRRHPESRRARATLTAVLLHHDSACIAQVGDSRAYLVRDGRIEQLTRDQTLAQALLDSGAISPDDCASNPPDMLLQSLGGDPTVRAVVTTVDLRAGDAVLVCSDGLSNVVDADELLGAIGGAAAPAEACVQLVELALSRVARDNVTAVVARVESSGHDVAPDEAVTWTFPNVFAGEN